MAALVTLDHPLIAISSLPCHLWSTAQRCLHRRLSGHLHTQTRPKTADMHISHPMADCVNIYTGRSLIIQHTHPTPIAMNTPPTAPIRLATTGAVNTTSHRPYGDTQPRTVLVGLPQDLLTNILRITKDFSRACRGPLLSHLSQ